MDCTLCLNCVRACPYDNVALTVRSPGRELAHSPWLKRGRLSVMVMAVLLTFWGVMNALAMITPFYGFAENLATWLGTRSEALLLTLLYAGISVVGMAASLVVMLAADAAGGATPRPRRALERWGYVVVALGFGFWGAHYTFHFLTGALSIVPVFQHFFEYRGFAVDPNWRLAQVIPSRWLFGIQAAISAAAAAIALATAWRIANRDFGRRGVLAMWPLVLFVLAFTAMQLVILAQPMEMRGTVLGPTL